VPPRAKLIRADAGVRAAYFNLESIIEDGVVNEHPSFGSRHDPRHRGPKPTWWGIVVSICSLLAAMAVVAIARGWL
jgi:hypothetical protein